MISEGDPITEQQGVELGWGAVVCQTNRNGHRTLHVKTGQVGYLYWTEVSDAEGESYPWMWGDENVTLWHNPDERTT